MNEGDIVKLPGYTQGKSRGEQLSEPTGTPFETIVYRALRDMAAEIGEDRKRWADAAERAERSGQPVTALLFRNLSLGKGI